VLVQGWLAYAMRRAAAARKGELGLQILTPPQLATRLAGGLLRPASRESIEAGIQAALSEPGLLVDMAPICDLPGMTRAVMRSLGNVWRSNFPLRAAEHASKPRVQDLIRIEDTVRARLHPGERLLPDLCEAARANIALAPRLIGDLDIDGVQTIDRLWRDLIEELAGLIQIQWFAPPQSDSAWFKGTLNIAHARAPSIRAVSCADPAHEALEAMRWTRDLIASGRAGPEDIAIAATSTAAWDDNMLGFADASGLPLSFANGRPALSTRDGQRCAALADTLHGGLSQARLRRLLALTAGQNTGLGELSGSDLPVSIDASLSTADDWERILRPFPDVAGVLMPALRVLESGITAAEQAGEMFLRGRALNLWHRALRAAPPSALMFSLSALRLLDERDPAGAIIWCTADQLASAPRTFVWLMGLTTFDWPRTGGLDPILPDFIVRSDLVNPDPVDRLDRRSFANIMGTSHEVTLSTCRRSFSGTRAAPSPLLSPVKNEDVLYRDLSAKHALTEADRLFSRPQDAGASTILTSSAATWRDWRRRELTAHDGLVGGPHPLLSALLTQPQSPTSLSLLLRDPLAYVWFYALGWRDLVHKERSLILAADDFGRLVHELLRRAVDLLEPTPGFTASQDHEKDEALELAATVVTETWPELINVPPPMLWARTVRKAAELARAGMKFEGFKAGTRSWTEVPFGGESRNEARSRDLPWDPDQPVKLHDTDIGIKGTIDRLDLSAQSAHVRVTDYKTGRRPKKPETVFLGRGGELQRVLYAAVCRKLLSKDTQLYSRLIYLLPPVKEYPLPKPDNFIEIVSAWATESRRVLEIGVLNPGGIELKARERFGGIALPASALYLPRKENAIKDAVGSDLTRHRSQR